MRRQQADPAIDGGDGRFLYGGQPKIAFSVMVRVPIRKSMIKAMQVTTGIVVDGKVVVEGDPLPDGTVVTIIARDAEETFEVPPELEAELLESIAQADRGETISADEVIERLRRIT
jgi:hypothetical protein